MYNRANKFSSLWALRCYTLTGKARSYPFLAAEKTTGNKTIFGLMFLAIQIFWSVYSKSPTTGSVLAVDVAWRYFVCMLKIWIIKVRGSIFNHWKCCPKDFLLNGGIDHLLLFKHNNWATERRVLKILYKPMARIYDKPGHPMEEQIWRNVVLPRRSAGDSPAWEPLECFYFHILAEKWF